MLKKITWRTIPMYILAVLLLLYSKPQKDIFLFAGILLAFVGEFFRIWGCGHLVKTKEFTITGPYAHLRHPLYLGTYLIATGFAIAAHLWWILILWQAIFALYYYPRKEIIEGVRLLKLYGDEFIQYAQNVPALIPALKGYKKTDQKWSFSKTVKNSEVGIFLLVVASAVYFWFKS